MSGLATLQRRLWRLLTAPDGVHAALAEAGDARGASLEPWLEGGARLPAADRLEVYANAYFHRVHDALAEDFGALACVLGEAAFHDLVTAYLLCHPPAHPSLRHAGARLPDFLSDDPSHDRGEGDAAAAPFVRRWPFVADLARLEWALVDAFDASDATPLARETLADVPPDAWEALRFALHPSAILLRVGWPVHRVREAWERAPDAVRAPERHEPTALLVWRRRERVLFRALEPDEATLLELVRGGAAFGALCERLAEERGAAEAPARAAALLSGWIESELLVAADAAAREAHAIPCEGDAGRA